MQCCDAAWRGRGKFNGSGTVAVILSNQARPQPGSQPVSLLLWCHEAPCSQSRDSVIACMHACMCKAALPIAGLQHTPVKAGPHIASGACKLKQGVGKVLQSRRSAL